MRFEKYPGSGAFGAAVLDILLENEAQNNHLVSFILRDGDKSDWLFATVKDDAGNVVLTAAQSGQLFNLVLYETGNKPDGPATGLLAKELKGLGFSLPGVLAEQGLAQRFAEAWTERSRLNLSAYIMRLDEVSKIEKSPGFARRAREDDLFYLPYWALAFSRECHVEVSDIPSYVNRIRARMNEPFLIWEDKHPVSQSASWRRTLTGSAVAWVYTPPHYRGKGYATSVVAELSQNLLERGNKFCCLFADAQNPVSRGIYRKIGYRDLCIYNDIKFS